MVASFWQQHMPGGLYLTFSSPGGRGPQVSVPSAVTSGDAVVVRFYDASLLLAGRVLRNVRVISLSSLHDRSHRLLLVVFGADLGNVTGAMAENDASGFEAGLFPQLSGGVVTELVGVPAAGLCQATSSAFCPCVSRFCHWAFVPSSCLASGLGGKKAWSQAR